MSILKPVFVDTGGWIAAIDKKDRHHENVKNWLDHHRGRPLITTHFVADETFTFLRRRVGHQSAVRFGTMLLESRLTQMIHITTQDFQSAWQIFSSYDDQDFSFTDCTSFAIMTRLKLQDVLAIDKHFYVMGFTPVAR